MFKNNVCNYKPTECPCPSVIESVIERITQKQFVEEQLKLIQAMRKEETEKSSTELQEFGNQILVEHISSRPGEFGGITLVFMEKFPDLRVPSLKKNQPVGAIQASHPYTNHASTERPFKGIVTRVGNNQYDVYFENTKMQPSRDWTLLRNFNCCQYDILEKAIKGIPKNKSRLKEVLFGNQPPNQTEIPDDPWFSWFYYPKLQNPELDASQFQAITFAMRQTELAVIFGPPGTGKTKTLHEIIHQSILRGEKILCTAATNVAVDNLGEKLIKGGIEVIRIGHPARVVRALVPHCLNVLVQRETQEISELDRKIQCTDDDLRTSWSMNEYVQLQELKKKKNNSQRRLNAAIVRHLKKVPVILATLTGCSSAFLNLLPKDHFNTCVIDECGQALESACWTAIHKAQKLIIAGDPLQLPPSIISTEKETEDKLKVSLIERLMKENTASNNLIFCMLNTQYRMNDAIMKWSSLNFYSGKLTADDSVKHQRLSDLPGVTTNDLATTALQLFDTKGKGYSEISNNASCGPSYANIGEAALVISYVKRLLEFGIKTEDIAIISPYKYQVEILNINLLNKGINVQSVDGFQGREKEVIIISMVRSNEEGKLGFLTEMRRLNVAITRAKRQLVIVCNTETICKDKFLEDFINYLQENGQIDTAPRLIKMQSLMSQIEEARLCQKDYEKCLIQELNNQKKKKEDLAEQLRKLKEAKVSLIEDNQFYEVRTTFLEGKVKSCTQEVKHLEGKLKLAQSEKENLSQELEESEERESQLRISNAKLEKENKEMKFIIKMYQQFDDVAQKTILEKDKLLNQAQSSKDAYESENASLRMKLKRIIENSPQRKQSTQGKSDLEGFGGSFEKESEKELTGHAEHVRDLHHQKNISKRDKLKHHGKKEK